jgi:hypothetical protein
MSFARRLDDRNGEFVNPGRDVTRARDPLNVCLSDKRREERPLHGGHFSPPVDFDSAEKRGGIGGALKRSPYKIQRPAHGKAAGGGSPLRAARAPLPAVPFLGPHLRRAQ